MLVVCLEVLEDYASDRHDRLRMNSLRNWNGLAPAFFVCVCVFPWHCHVKLGGKRGHLTQKKQSRGPTE